jgi:hypothetical protein
MKKIKILTIGFSTLIAVLMLTGCSKKSDNPVAPTQITSAEANIVLNGAGYTNKSITLSNGLCGYSIPDTTTVVYFNGTNDGDSLHLYIVFKGNHTGTINWDQDNGSELYKNTSSGYLTFIGISQGTTTVNTYGAVGDKIEGNINGKLIESTSQTELTISGSFSAVRVPDSN